MVEPLEHQEVDILESVLDQAFSAPPPSLKPEPKPEATSEVAAPTGAPEAQPEASFAVAPLEASGSTASLEDSWKAEYEAQVQSWRAQSAEAREKAEKERLRWEAIRAAEKEEAAKRKAAGIVDEPPSQGHGEGWESVGGPSTVASSSQLTELVSVESEPAQQPQPSAVRREPTTDLSRTHSRPDTNTDESQKWEDVPSVTSSFPSMTFPENIDTPPPPRSQPAAAAPVSVTLAIFDSSLSTRTRLKAFVSSLAVNLLLPFVNGVMLGFGEIFAKNVVMGWFGWKSSGSTAANVGVRSSTPREIRQRQAGFR